jgi:RNA polymerase sigma-70 factor (ECF subfamily)
MTTIDTDVVVSAATAGDRVAFARLFARYRREVMAHAYRILGSREDAEDLTQETFLRSWDKRETFRGQSTYRTWLYQIATNACLTALKRRRHARLYDSDGLLEAIETRDASPEEAVVSNETVELALHVVIERMPPKQRTVLILRDLLGWSARDVADLLDCSVASANSALQRARATLKDQLSSPRIEWARALDRQQRNRALVEHYLEIAA